MAPAIAGKRIGNMGEYVDGSELVRIVVYVRRPLVDKLDKVKGQFSRSFVARFALEELFKRLKHGKLTVEKLED